jgi:hypothetical protein
VYPQANALRGVSDPGLGFHTSFYHLRRPTEGGSHSAQEAAERVGGVPIILSEPQNHSRTMRLNRIQASPSIVEHEGKLAVHQDMDGTRDEPSKLGVGKQRLGPVGERVIPPSAGLLSTMETLYNPCTKYLSLIILSLPSCPISRLLNSI